MMQGRFGKWMAGLFLLLLVNTAYLAAFASPTIFYMSNVLLHLGLGLVLAAGLVWWLARSPEARRSIPLAAALFILALLAGIYLMIFGNVLANRWAFWAHVVTAGLGVAALAPWVWRKANEGAIEGNGWRRFRTGFAVAAALLVVLPLATAAWRKANPNPSNRIKNPLIVPTSMQEEGGGPQSPFFPSSANTNTKDIIPSNFFMDSKVCGECHKDIYEQWNSSAHHFASFNNQFYRKSIEYMQDVVGPQPSKWCAGCHDHAVFFNGRFERPIKEQLDTPEAHAGLACTSCHAITHVNSSMGNGGFTIEYPPLHQLLTSRNKVVRAMDRFLTYTDPEPHKKTFMKPFMRLDSAEFCSSCHKVHLDVPVNSYRWFRGFNDYDNWQASGVSGQGARSFYYPAESKTCANCHMPLIDSQDPGNVDGKVHSHRFPAANTALAHVNQDAKQMEATEKFLKSGFIKVDIFAVAPVESTGETEMIRRAGDRGPQLMSTFGVGEEAEQTGDVFLREVGKVAAPIEKANPVLAPGSTARVDVVVRTKAIGHFFPGGTVDAFDIWLELQARDADGRIVYWSGKVDENPDGTKGPVEAGAHFYRSYQLDGAGNPIDKRNAWQARSVLYVRLIPPGAADVAHYRIKVPEDARGPLTLTAKLNYRKFAHSYTQFAYAGKPKPGQAPELVSADHNSQQWSFDPANIPANVSGKIKGRIPDLPIVTLAEDTAELKVGRAGEKTETVWKPVIAKEDRERWNDWGIGMMLQGDLKGAEYAFQRTTEAEPGYADGWLNVARALIREGELERAKPYVQKALAVDSKLGRIHYFKALIQKAEGDYDGALASLRTVESKYPRDRVVLNQMARILFLKREYKEALEVLDRVCMVDPEDLQMHYTAMLCWRALGNQEKAAREAKLFRRFKADESSQAITAERRRISPEDNNERQPIHEHESVPLDRIAIPTDTAVAAGAGG
ncbi:MAG: tetratricopeptide repeat protein [Thermoanaerobaculia bacterium]